ncbi:MAG TPA: putative nucleotidyltransferase substrate binding domain-containing protein [Solirubrobacteraceae bacterium]|nr:putative nucleotidyltransferase substrate binding domain-containing protein [Solirubrobacteraceae bacterium]
MIARFLAQRPPFDALAPEELSKVAAHAAMEFHARGTVILSEDGGTVTFLRVIHSGAVDIGHDGRLLDLLGPGDAFGHAAMLSGLPPGFEARAAEDTLCYRIPVAVARPLLDRSGRRELSAGRAEAFYQPVAKLIRTPTVTCRPSENIGVVAQRMTLAGANAAIVELDDGGGRIGIITDRDLRTRVLAAGRSGAIRADSVMTAPVYAVSPDRLGGEVLYEMLERGIRHAPVISERGGLVGVLEAVDLYGAQPRAWFGARRAIERVDTLDALSQAADSLPELMLDLHHSSVAALELAPVLSALVDALTRRALELASPPGDPPPDGLVWVAVGSQARRELTLASVRRGAVVHASGRPPAGRWREIAQDALGRCGLAGPVVAHDARGWLAGAGGGELGLSVLTDRRVLWGTPAEPLPVADGAPRDALLRGLGERAFAHTLPTGFDTDSVLSTEGRHSRLNLREAAIVPIAAIARWASVRARAGEGSTPERLHAAVDAGVLTRAQAQTLTEAFELALELRIVHQLEQIEAGQVPDDLLDAPSLSPLTRARLRDVFRAVSTVQRELAP